MATKKTDAPTTALSAVDEAWLKENALVGTETIAQIDLPLPYLNLVQKTTKAELKDGGRAALGSYYYTATKESSPNFFCTLLSVRKTERTTYIDKTKMEFVWEFLGAREGDFRPFIFACRSSAIGAAKRFVGVVRSMQRPMFSLKVVLSSEMRTGDYGDYYVPIFTEMGVRDNQAELLKLKELASKYHFENAVETEEGNILPLPSQTVKELEKELEADAAAAEAEASITTPTTEKVADSDIPF